ncbi:MAG: hypothetical protein M3R43_00470 [Acidobacteriota bacterium]|nr:hypothetical protein [Acidobacteriota bacterium]
MLHSHKNDSVPTPGRRWFCHAAVAALTLCILLIHGYHPFAEDGGLYVAGIESVLNPSLFPHDLAFATATRHYSLFAPFIAQLVRALHIPLPWLLLLAYLAGAWLLLYAAWKIAAQCFRSERAQVYAVALLAAWYSLPIAGTSLLLMDPYVTARTFSTPLSLLAIAFALNFQWQRKNATLLLRCVACLALAAAFHPLMATYAAGLIVALLVAKSPSRRVQLSSWIILAVSAVLAAALLQIIAPAESAAAIVAATSRYYWFLSQWQWYELLGLAGPLVVLVLLMRYARATLGESGTALCRASIAVGLIAMLVSLLFAHEQFSTHLVARLQPLRAFLLLYAIMTILLGATLADLCLRWPRLRILPPLCITAMACVMFFAQRQTFPASQHLELPWGAPTNPWSRAFLWARDNTPTDALFALDANYVTTPGEDAQTFRATAERSVLPDFSKDGGEAAIRPALATDWFVGMVAQKDLSRLTDAERDTHLNPMHVSWLLLLSTATTSNPCPYDNGTVKICRLDP